MGQPRLHCETPSQRIKTKIKSKNTIPGLSNTEKPLLRTLSKYVKTLKSFKGTDIFNYLYKDKNLTDVENIEPHV